MQAFARRTSIAAVAALVSLSLVPMDANALATITEFPIASSMGPGPITGSTNGFVWFAEPNDDTIGRIGSTGALTEYLLPDSYQEPRGIAAGPSGTVWFTETGSHTGSEGIARIDASGTITEFPLPDGSVPYGIALGPDGNMWFTQLFGRIGMITPSGTATTFPARLQNEPLNIVSGPDGALWFTEDGIVEGGTGAIGRITTSGDLTEYLLPTPSGLHSGAGDITVGADGNLWFTWVTLDPAQPLATASHSVGRITPAGTITEFPVSAGGGWPPGGIAAGPDGNLWFAQGHANSLGRMSTAGVLTEFPVPTTDGFPADVTVGSDGNVWFSEANASKIGRVNLVAPAPTIESFAPASGAVGTSVIINGTSFTGATSVTFNGVMAAFVINSDTKITATVPIGATTGRITVTTTGGSATSAASFTVGATHPRTVTLNLAKHLVARGVVSTSDGFTTCTASVPVKIQRRVSGHWKTVATTTTTASGSYKEKIPNHSSKYRSKALMAVPDGGTDICAAATSPVRVNPWMKVSSRSTDGGV
jgi:virginiamycin B lyase